MYVCALTSRVFPITVSFKQGGGRRRTREASVKVRSCAQATAVVTAGKHGITLQNTLVRMGEAETQSVAQPVGGVKAAGIDDVRTLMQQILQSVGVTKDHSRKLNYKTNSKTKLYSESAAVPRAAAGEAETEGAFLKCFMSAFFYSLFLIQ